MDGPTFDAKTRSLAGRATRRRFLAAPAGIGFGFRRFRPIAGADPTPLSSTFGTCPATGKGRDPDLNVVKNRTDAVDADAWQPVIMAAILALPEPAGTMRYLANQPTAAAMQVTPILGGPVRVEAFAVGVAGRSRPHILRRRGLAAQATILSVRLDSGGARRRVSPPQTRRSPPTSVVAVAAGGVSGEPG